jgi:hypothetical protein
VKFFFDNCISPKLTAAMQLLCAGHHNVEHLTTRFAADTSDIDWLRALAAQLAAQPETIIISGDPAITTAKKEREVWRASSLTSFFFGGGFTERNFWVQASEVVRWWPAVVMTARDAPCGSGYLLPMGGTTPKPFYQPLSSSKH